MRRYMFFEIMRSSCLKCDWPHAYKYEKKFSDEDCLSDC